MPNEAEQRSSKNHRARHSERFAAVTDELWETIRSVRRKWPDDIDWPEVRRLIEEAGQEFSEVTALRERRRRSVRYKEVLQSAQSHAFDLHSRLLELQTLSPQGDDLDGLPDPKIYRDRLDYLRTQYDIWSTPFGGRANRIRETLINRLLSVWEEQLHGKIRSSKDKVDEPIGPLLRFLTRTLTAITGDAPGRSGVESIIDQAKKRRRSGKSKRRMPTRSPSKQQGQKN
jgi:hypothetical protein